MNISKIALGVMVMAAGVAMADSLEVSPYFTDHMVLQRGKPATVWGKDVAGRTVTVNFDGKSATAVAGADGIWEATFTESFAASSTPRALTVSDDASESLSLTDVLVGDVYLMGGQSNMDIVPVSEDFGPIKTFCRADDGIRVRRVLRTNRYTTEETYAMPTQDVQNRTDAGWGSCQDDDIRLGMNSVQMNFARYIRDAQPNVPMGVVQVSYMGTGIRGHIPGPALTAAGFAAEATDGFYWNVMMAPMRRARFCGVLWYQGESDATKSADTYASLLHVLVGAWRSVWGENLPFYAVQIATPGSYYAAGVTDSLPAPTTVSDANNYTAVREGQRLWDESETGPHGLVVICDYAETLPRSLHPLDKNTVGRRLSLLVRRDIYGESSLQAEGPKYDGAVVNADGSVTVSFKPGTATGLTAGKVVQCTSSALSSWTSTSVPVKGFALKGNDGTWRAATATVNGSTVVLTADGISAGNKAVQFHYGCWNLTRDDQADDGQRLTFYNAAGLPLSPIAPQAVESAAPSVEPGLKWTTGEYDPSSWTALEDNVLAGLTAVATDAGQVSSYASKDLSKLTDGVVDPTASSSNLVGFREGAEIAWTFAEPMTIRKLRFQSLQTADKKIYAGIRIADVLVQTSRSSDWISLGASVSKSGNSTSAGAQYALVENPGLGYLALDVTKLKVVFGTAEAFADYYPEIEAAGERSSVTPAESPVVRTTKLVPWGSSAEFRCKLDSIGSGASKCDVTLAYGPDADHLGAPSVIYSGNLAAFNYELEGLSLNTTYSYRLTALNDAATPASCTVDGTFTTTGEVRPDWSDYKWAVIGDSLTDPTLAPGLGNYYYNFVARDTGIQLAYTNGVGSTGYKNRYNENRCFYQRLLANPLPSDVDVVTIFGSVNDWGQVRNEADAGSSSDTFADDKTTLAAYMNKAIDVIEEQAPDAKIVLVGSLYYYNVLSSAHIRANETLRAVAAARGVAYYDWLTENPLDPLDFHHIADDPLAEGSFAQRYTRDCPKTIIPGETSFGHPSAEYHEEWISPHFRAVLAAALSGEPVNPPAANYTITVTPPSNGTLTTSPSGSVAAGTVVTVTATPDSGYQLVSVTVNGVAITGSTFTMPAANITVAATFESTSTPIDPPPSGDKMFYIGETGYDSFADVMAAVKNGDVIRVGANATFSMNLMAGKSITFDLCGQKLTWESGGYVTSGSITVTDSCAPAGRFELASGNRNYQTLVDMSALTSTQLTGSGKFWSGAGTRVVFPSDMTWDPCLGFMDNKVSGEQITVLGATYTYDGIKKEWIPETPPATYTITIAAPQNGTLETSVTNGVAAGTVVTVTATPASGYQLVSVTVNGAAITGNTFTMPAANATVAATFEETSTPPVDPPVVDKMFYIGETGYDSWSDAYSAAKDGDTIKVGLNASFAVSGGKQITIDLCGRAATWNAGGYAYTKAITVIDSGAGAGALTLASGNLNTKTTVDLSALSASQISGSGKFYFGPSTKVIFPVDMPYADCMSHVTFQQTTAGSQVVIQGKTYTWDGSAWVKEAGASYPEWIDDSDATVTAKYDTWATAKGVSDPEAALEDAYLLNCANTSEAVATAKAAFKITSIAIDAEGNVTVGEPVAPAGGFNGTVTIQGCPTLDGSYHAKQSGDLFFKAVLAL